MVVELDNKDSRIQSFDLVTILIFIGSVLGLCFWKKIPFLLSLALIIIAIWMLFILAGRLVAPFYLEGCMIRMLIANNGKAPLEYFQTYFNKYETYKLLIRRLVDRNIIEINNETVVLNGDNYKKGFKNYFMMWGTRKVRY